MTSRTKIIVLRLKELIYTGLFAALGIILIVLLLAMFLPDKNKDNTGTVPPENNNHPASGTQNTAFEVSTTSYIPGIYSTALNLGEHAVDVEVIVDSNNINSIRLVNLNEAITTMYPLLQPTFDSLAAQIYEKQSLEGITYTDDSKYTCLVLLQAIESSLAKAVSTENSTSQDTAH